MITAVDVNESENHVHPGMTRRRKRGRRPRLSNDTMIRALIPHALDYNGSKYIDRYTAANVFIKELHMPVSSAYARIRELRALGYLREIRPGYYQISYQY